jgi:hypothetical protein
MFHRGNSLDLMTATRKEAIRMKYEKPEIVVLQSAVAAVQGVGKFNHGNPDGMPGPTHYTINAYEADE